VYRTSGSVLGGNGYSSSDEVVVFAFDYRRGQAVDPFQYVRTVRNTSGRDVARGELVSADAWTPVTGILPSPNLWGKTPLPQHGTHVFFLFEGGDAPAYPPRGFFVETLRPELREIRRTLEAYLAQGGVEGEPLVRGLGMTDEKAWDLDLRVTHASGTVGTYRIDRWD
jgi:hypothetical protein